MAGWFVDRGFALLWKLTAFATQMRLDDDAVGTAEPPARSLFRGCSLVMFSVSTEWKRFANFADLARLPSVNITSIHEPHAVNWQPIGAPVR